jgi:small subunit ribosomal protein S7
MPRRRVAAKRVILPEPRYKSTELAKFINYVMYSGERAVAESIVYGALDIIGDKFKIAEADYTAKLSIFKKALENIRPIVEVKSRRVGGATYQVPIEVKPLRASTLAMRWLVEFARKRGSRSMMIKLAEEIIDAADEESSTGGSKGKGGAIKKREDTHRMAAANQAFSHFRW